MTDRGSSVHQNKLKGQHKLTTRWLPGPVVYYKGLIEKQALAYQVDAALLAIIMTVESGGYSRAVSQQAAKGLMQITPIAEGDIRSRYLHRPLQKGAYDIFDPATNIEFGAAFISWIRNHLAAKYPAVDDSRLVEAGAAAYNGGLEGAAYLLLAGEGAQADEAAFYGRMVRDMWLERLSDHGWAYKRWRELDVDGLNLIGLAEAEQAGK